MVSSLPIRAVACSNSRLPSRLSLIHIYVLAVYRLIAEAESAAHDKPVTEVHFHEVGAMDAVADVTAVCMLLHELAPVSYTHLPVKGWRSVENGESAVRAGLIYGCQN